MTERLVPRLERWRSLLRTKPSEKRKGVGAPARGFTLIELLVSIGIVGILLSLVLPMLGRTIAASRGFKCQQSLRSVAYDFRIFADDNLHGYRGEIDRTSPALFTIDNFVESQYGVHEFWAWPGETRHDLPDAAGNDPMRCSEVRGQVTLRSNMPCTGGAISPSQNVSFGFNIRLRIAERASQPGVAEPVYLTDAIMVSPAGVPLVWDVDGAAAAAQGQLPIFSGPSLDSPDVFAGDVYWFPGMRHNGTGNFAFIDGHVTSSTRPMREPTWNWAFSPRR